MPRDPDSVRKQKNTNAAWREFIAPTYKEMKEDVKASGSEARAEFRPERDALNKRVKDAEKVAKKESALKWRLKISAKRDEWMLKRDPDAAIKAMAAENLKALKAKALAEAQKKYKKLFGDLERDEEGNEIEPEVDDTDGEENGAEVSEDEEATEAAE